MTARRVLNVGQCAADAWAIRKTIENHFGAEVVSADTTAQALAAMRAGSFDLVLVNRILDRDGTPGLDLIRQAKDDPSLRHLPIMLVSNYPDAQKQAVELGAASGFGKNSLGQPEMLERLQPFLGRD